MTVDELIDRLQEFGGHLRVKILIRGEDDETEQVSLEKVINITIVDYSDEHSSVILE